MTATFALVQCSDGEWRPAIGGRRWIDDSLVWVFSDGKYRDAELSITRPLVVIDPEDREQVERLTERYIDKFGGYASDVLIDALTAALREFANPTPLEPEEPTGLGAVVEDANGRRWMRGGSHLSYPWLPADKPGAADWAEIPAVRVLSEGVAQ